MIAKKTKLLIISLLVMLVVLLAVLVLTKPKPKSPSPAGVIIFQPSPTPASAANGGPLAGHSYTYSSSQTEAVRQQQEAVTRLISKLPYTGTYLVISYDLSSMTIFVTFNKEHQSEANQEMDNYLRSQGVLDRSWINKLVIN